jgi:hypothetical protein
MQLAIAPMIQGEPVMPKKEDRLTLRVRKGATLKEIHAAYKKQFTAADLQKYTEIEPMVPAEQVLAEVEAICAEDDPKPPRKRKKS